MTALDGGSLVLTCIATAASVRDTPPFRVGLLTHPMSGPVKKRAETIKPRTVLLAMNHKAVKAKVAPIECDKEQVVQRRVAAVAAHVQTPPNRRVDLENQDVELVNFDRSVWLDHSRSRSLIAARSQRPVFPGLLVAQGQDFS